MVDSKTKPEATLATETVVAKLSFLEDLSRRDFTLAYQGPKGEHTIAIDHHATVGSASRATVHLPDRTVSRLHCELRERDGELWVKDLESKNGTWVNGVRVLEACVPEGARLQLGQSELRVGRELQERTVGLWPHERFGSMVGRSVQSRELFSTLHRFAATNAPVLILGETGTGKDEAARAVHTFSPRNRKPFVVLDCTAFSEQLIESELFGHARGAFTGAIADREGAFEAADRGTLFLDEVGELPLEFQTRLLRVLETGEVRRLGEHEVRKVDVRIIAATHRDLRKMVNAGTFREDLYFRLAVLEVTMPPLRERPDDIELLYRALAPKGAPEPSDELLAEIRRQSWPGNIRQLRNYLVRHFAGLPQPEGAFEAESLALPAPDIDTPFKVLREQWNAHLERTYFKKLLARHDTNVTETARAAGVSRAHLHELIKRHGL